MARLNNPVPELDQTQDEVVSALDGDGANGTLLTMPPVVVEEIPYWAEEVQVAQEGMLGAVMQLLVQGMEQTVRPWKEMKENEQRVVLDHFRFNATPIIRTAVETIASKGRRIVVGTMEQVTTKEAIKAVISCQKSPEACAAFGMTAGGGHVALILMNTEVFLQEIHPVDAAPDQKSFDLYPDEPLSPPDRTIF